MTARRGMGELESEVMGQLWAAGQPLTPAEVRDALANDVPGPLSGDLAYTTVMTILGRLWAKGLAHRERRGRAYAYWPSLSEEELTAQRMRTALDRAGDREKTLARFVDSLSCKDARSLRRILGRLSSEK